MDQRTLALPFITKSEEKESAAKVEEVKDTPDVKEIAPETVEENSTSNLVSPAPTCEPPSSLNLAIGYIPC